MKKFFIFFLEKKFVKNCKQKQTFIISMDNENKELKFQDILLLNYSSVTNVNTKFKCHYNSVIDLGSYLPSYSYKL